MRTSARRDHCWAIHRESRSNRASGYLWSGSKQTDELQAVIHFSVIRGRRMNKTEKLLCELIALPSVNPAFLSAGDPHGGERRVADFLAAGARRVGLDVTFQPVLPQRENLLARLAPVGKAQQRLLLAPHFDTVGGADIPGRLFT